MNRLHITGCRRSGTTLLFEMMATCFRHDQRCEHEQSIFVPINQMADQLYFSKKPSDITHIHNIFKADSQLNLLYVRRDPRAVITSFHPTKSDVYYASFERWLRYEQAVKPLLDHPRFHLVEYEALVTQPNQVQQAIEQSFSNLQKKHDFADFHQFAESSEKAQISLKGLRPISQHSLTAWQDHLPRIKFQLEKYPQLAESIIEYGYESSHDWLKILDGVAGKSQQYGESPPNWLKRFETDLRYKIKSRHYLNQIS